MDVLYAQVAEIISNVAEIDINKITPDKHIFADLLIDSLAFLDIVFDIDKVVGVKLPVEDWLTASDKDDAYRDSRFTVGAIVAYLDERRTALAQA